MLEAGQHAEPEWILWLSHDVVLVDPDFTFPFSQYTLQNSSIIFWGKKEQMLKGDVSGAMSWNMWHCGQRPPMASLMQHIATVSMHVCMHAANQQLACSCSMF